MTRTALGRNRFPCFLAGLPTKFLQPRISASFEFGFLLASFFLLFLRPDRRLFFAVVGNRWSGLLGRRVHCRLILRASAPAPAAENQVVQRMAMEDSLELEGLCVLLGHLIIANYII